MSGVREDVHSRDQLLGLVARYMEALVARDPDRLPLASDVRYVENTQALPLGKGVWRTITGSRPRGQSFADVEAGQVEHWGIIDEMSATAILAVRLRVREGLIDEIETLVVPGTGMLFDAEGINRPRPAFHEVLEPERRVSRDELIRVANLYFDAIEQANGDLVPVDDDCVRIENGVQTTLVPPDEPVDTAFSHRRLGVRKQLNDGHFTYIEAIRERRFPIVDVERGLVLAHGFFDHPGDLARRSGAVPFRSPNSMQLCEAFKVRGGRLHEVWAVGRAFPYGIGSGWR